MTKQEKLKLLTTAADHLRVASEALKDIADDKRDQYLRADALSIKADIDEILECDHGQAGLLVLIRRIEEKA